MKYKVSLLPEYNRKRLNNKKKLEKIKSKRKEINMIEIKTKSSGAELTSNKKDGIEYMLQKTKDLPISVYFMIPSCIS